MSFGIFPKRFQFQSQSMARKDAYFGVFLFLFVFGLHIDSRIWGERDWCGERESGSGMWKHRARTNCKWISYIFCHIGFVQLHTTGAHPCNLQPLNISLSYLYWIDLTLFANPHIYPIVLRTFCRKLCCLTVGAPSSCMTAKNMFIAFISNAVLHFFSLLLRLYQIFVYSLSKYSCYDDVCVPHMCCFSKANFPPQMRPTLFMLSSPPTLSNPRNSHSTYTHIGRLSTECRKHQKPIYLAKIVCTILHTDIN